MMRRYQLVLCAACQRGIVPAGHIVVPARHIDNAVRVFRTGIATVKFPTARTPGFMRMHAGF
jgi:hypothetical protein